MAEHPKGERIWAKILRVFEEPLRIPIKNKEPQNEVRRLIPPYLKTTQPLRLCQDFWYSLGLSIVLPLPD
jgi:hypothetical protein